MELVDVCHDFPEVTATDLDQFAVSERQDGGGTRSTVDDGEVSEGVAIGEGFAFFVVDFDLAETFEYDVIGAASVSLSEEVGVGVCGAGFNFFDEAVDFGGRELGEDEVFVECFSDFSFVGLAEEGVAVVDVVGQVQLLSFEQQGVFSAFGFTQAGLRL